MTTTLDKEIELQQFEVLRLKAELYDAENKLYNLKMDRLEDRIQQQEFDELLDRIQRP